MPHQTSVPGVCSYDGGWAGFRLGRKIESLQGVGCGGSTGRSTIWSRKETQRPSRRSSASRWEHQESMCWGSVHPQALVLGNLSKPRSQSGGGHVLAARLAPSRRQDSKTGPSSPAKPQECGLKLQLESPTRSFLPLSFLSSGAGKGTAGRGSEGEAPSQFIPEESFLWGRCWSIVIAVEPAASYLSSWVVSPKLPEVQCPRGLV